RVLRSGVRVVLVHCSCFFFFMIRLPPSSRLFPYPTLFRSNKRSDGRRRGRRARARGPPWRCRAPYSRRWRRRRRRETGRPHARRSEEHTSELQSLTNLVCRLLLEKKKHNHHHPTTALIGDA